MKKSSLLILVVCFLLGALSRFVNFRKSGAPLNQVQKIAERPKQVTEKQIGLDAKKENLETKTISMKKAPRLEVRFEQLDQTNLAKLKKDELKSWLERIDALIQKEGLIAKANQGPLDENERQRLFAYFRYRDELGQELAERLLNEDAIAPAE